MAHHPLRSEALVNQGMDMVRNGTGHCATASPSTHILAFYDECSEQSWSNNGQLAALAFEVSLLVGMSGEKKYLRRMKRIEYKIELN
ncbi:hypothetical protein BC938DRAFT_472102 [Jimgerdemannia flammicorona]|uniref:Uncharacterized protein n=1 Tax=Jimgerdemannia flammicorona TaxID=994334 RepID=A0A433QU60_9FUNG|nr:hypothetical protein BC938DRAFT_472102 [Jimgerdemannia flammicorona]